MGNLIKLGCHFVLELISLVQGLLNPQISIAFFKEIARLFIVDVFS